MKEAYLGLGTNIGAREDNLQKAVDALRLLPKTQVKKISAVYETAPVGYTDQADFLNLCVRLETALSPSALLGACLGIEAAMGRQRPFPNAPRVMDIDLLLYEGVELATEELTVPHKEMRNRAFVLYPLRDAAIGGRLVLDFESALQQVEGQRILRTAITIY